MSHAADTAVHRPVDEPPVEERPFWRSLGRGLRRRCPRCGEGGLFRGYLRLKDCPACGCDHSNTYADDFPPYITIFIVGHVVVALLLMGVRAGMSQNQHILVWPTLTVVMTLVLLPLAKGAVVGFMWSKGLRGDEQR